MNQLAKITPAEIPMARAVLETDPDTNTAELVYSVRQHGVAPVIKTRMKFPVNPSTGETLGLREEVAGASLTVAPNADVGAALREVCASLRPATEADMEMWLGKLSLVAVRKKTDELESELTLLAYTERLVAYPGDIVRDTLQSWHSKWFPTWGELKEIMDRRVAPRLAVKTALEHHQADNTKPHVDPTDRAAVKKRIDMLRWSIERVEQGRPFPEHRQWPRDEWPELIKELKAEIKTLTDSQQIVEG